MDLVYGSALWFTQSRVNCHHLAERLAAERPTLFVESVGARAPSAHDWRRIAARLLRSLRPLRKVGPRLWIFSPLPLPAYRGGGAAANTRWVGRQLRALLALRRWKIDASWVFHPMGLGSAEQAQARGTIYYCVDDYAANPGVDAPTIRRLEAALVERADLTITTAEPLASRLRPLARRVEVLPNVADTELFLRDASVVRHRVLEAIDALPHPRLGYLGNLATYKIDLELVNAIARARPEWSVVLVGPANQGDLHREVTAAASPSNVHWLGEVPHATAPAVIDRFDVALLPSARHEVMQASFPLKFFEYLLRGKPVVARPIPALEPFQEWIDQGNEAGEFVAAVERQLAGDSELLAGRRRAFAASFGWTERMEKLRA
ncbi:MAG TPA: glycosyltransferase, partial [Gemmatimonadales bacterium]